MAKKKTQEDSQQYARETRLALFREGRLPVSSGTARLNAKGPQPVVGNLGDRSKLTYTWRSLETRKVSIEDSKDARVVLDPDILKNKMATKADYVGTYYGHRGIMRPEYDLLEPFTLVDTEAYLKQATNRRLALVMRNGYEIVNHGRQEYSDYLKKRLDRMEYAMRRPIMNLFRDILTNLSLCSNCFLLKIRDEEGAGVPPKKKGKVPVAGYTIIPAHQIFPYLDKGVISKWRRFYESGMPYEDYSVDDIIHLKWDCKPGHIYGTPRTVGVRDDIFALRRLEENIELLFINYLFPLFHIKVGSPEAPCTYYQDGTSEIDMIRMQIENMPKEGVFVTDERVEVKAVGAEKQALNTEKILAHLKNRVFAGLGMSPLDMGEGDTANRSTADNISQVLKDSIKADLDSFAGQIRMAVFAELFLEANISLSVQEAVSACHLTFHEIDMDNKIKEENHAIQLYQNHAIGHPEFRKRIKMKPMEESDHKETHHERHTKDLITHEHKLNLKAAEADVENQKALIAAQITLVEAQANAEHSKAEAEHKKAAAEGIKAEAKVKVLKAKTVHAKVAGKAKPNKTASNKAAPANQHGRKTSPSRAKSSMENLTAMVMDKLNVVRDIWDKKDMKEWKQLSTSAIDGAEQEFLGQIDEAGENSYTSQVRKGLTHLKDLVAGETDPEMLYVLVTEQLTEEDIDDTEIQSSTADDLDDSFEERTSGSSDEQPTVDPSPTAGDEDSAPSGE